MWLRTCGAVLEVAPGVGVDAALLARWRAAVDEAVTALRWPAGEIVAWPHAGGATLALAAPVDRLFCATEVNEWALGVALLESDVLPPTHHHPIDPALLEFARQLRESCTDAESFFWQLLRDRRIGGLKFRRQHAVAPYVLDFYCDELKLAIELDGGQHGDSSNVERDHARDRFLAERGIDVMRVWNHDALARTPDVLSLLDQTIAARRQSLAAAAEKSLLPAGEGAGRRMRAPRLGPASRQARSVAPSSALRAPSPAGRRKLKLPHAPGHPAAWDDTLAMQTLQALSRTEAEPDLLALLRAAGNHAIPTAFDDTTLTLGRGTGSRTWPRTALPAPADVPWPQLHTIPTALVTGSNGKTTTTRLLAALARAHGWIPGFSSTDGLVVGDTLVEPGDYSGPFGARAVLRDPRVTAAILETARGGMLRRGLAVDTADVAVVTNVSADHYGEYGVYDLAGIARVKLAVARAVEADGLLVLNADDTVLRDAATSLAGRRGWFGLDAAALARLRGTHTPVCGPFDGHLILERDGLAHDLGAITALPLTVQGRARYNIANLAAAAVAASELGIEPATMARVFARFGASNTDNRGRLERWALDGIAVWLDYAHNPDGLASLLDVVRGGGSSKRLGLLLGQAGNRLDADLRALAATAARGQPARVVLKDIAGYERGRADGDVAQVLHAGLLDAGVPSDAIVYRGNEIEAVRDLLAWARPGDTLVLPVHGTAARRAVIALLDAMQRDGWRAGQPVPAA